MKSKEVVISLSGGMDSSTLLLHYLHQGYNCTCISFDYGQKHKIELRRAEELVKYINSIGKYGLSHKIIELKGLPELLDSTLVIGGGEVPEGHYAEDNQKQTVVPNRNKIFGSIVQAIALSISKRKNTECLIALGLHAGDHEIYPDCRDEFRNADYKAFLIGNWDAEKVKYDAPFIKVTKYEILQHGLECCKDMDIDFDEVYRRTNTSYKPIFWNGEWHSDYKSASSIERIEAFLKLGRPDPVSYADETGKVDWEVATKHAKHILNI